MEGWSVASTFCASTRARTSCPLGWPFVSPKRHGLLYNVPLCHVLHRKHGTVTVYSSPHRCDSVTFIVPPYCHRYAIACNCVHITMKWIHTGNSGLCNDTSCVVMVLHCLNSKSCIFVFESVPALPIPFTWVHEEAMRSFLHVYRHGRVPWVLAAQKCPNVLHASNVCHGFLIIVHPGLTIKVGGIVPFENKQAPVHPLWWMCLRSVLETKWLNSVQQY